MVLAGSTQLNPSLRSRLQTGAVQQQRSEESRAPIAGGQPDGFFASLKMTKADLCDLTNVRLAALSYQRVTAPFGCRVQFTAEFAERGSPRAFDLRQTQPSLSAALQAKAGTRGGKLSPSTFLTRKNLPLRDIGKLLSRLRNS